MASVTPLHPSGLTNGIPIAVTNVATPGNIFHTAVNVAGQQDEVWLYACNVDVVSRKLTVQLGGVAVKDGIVVTIPAESGAYLIISGIRLSGGVIVRCYADVADMINVHGNINRYAA